MANASGAAGYLTNDCSPHELVHAIRSVNGSAGKNAGGTAEPKGVKTARRPTAGPGGENFAQPGC